MAFWNGRTQQFETIPVVLGSPPEGADSGITIKLCDNGIAVGGMDSDAVEWQKRTGQTLYIGIRKDGAANPYMEVDSWTEPVIVEEKTASDRQ